MNLVPILIGSGVSIAGKLPSVEQLSARVKDSVTDGADAALLSELEKLCDEDREAFGSNYEDWLYIAVQVRDHLLRDYENPALLPLILHLKAALNVSADLLRSRAETLVVRLIQAVSMELRAGGQGADAYCRLAEALTNRPQAVFRFFSLNHDTLLEQYLRIHNVSFYDGFSPRDQQRPGRHLNFDSTEFGASRISLIKLHGSVDWWRHRYLRARNESNPWIYEFIGIDIPDDGETEQPGQTPLMLVGTFNKILQYSSPVFLKFIAEFCYTLEKGDRLVICGYGFGDKGINSLITNWMSANTGRRLWVVDPEPFAAGKCRGAILSKVSIWASEGRLNLLKARVGADISWDQIIAAVA